MTEKAKELLSNAGNICLFVKENCEDGQTARYMSEAIDAINEAVSSSSAPGDAAVLREALESCLDFIIRIDRAFNPYMQGLLEDAVAKAKAALAASARNCDVGTAEEQAKRFKAFCLPKVGKCSESSKCPAKHPCNQIGIQYCQLKWAQMPYEADESK